MIEYAEKIRLSQVLHEGARQMRGRFLNTVAVVDAQAADIIALYFCDDDKKRALFMSEVITSQSFSLRMKEQIIKKIVKTECNFYLTKHPDLLKEFEAIRTLRNKMAHAVVDLSDEALLRGPEDIGFLYFKDGEEQIHRVTRAEADAYDARGGMLLSHLWSIARLLGVPARYSS